MIKETLIFILAILLWLIIQISIDSKNPCSNFSTNNIQGNCMQDIE